MKLSAKVKDPESTVVEMTIEMPMKEWNLLRIAIANTEVNYSLEELGSKITYMHYSMLRVVEGEVSLEENGDENPKNT